nr:unnamed protein product [Digitaria exilis]
MTRIKSEKARKVAHGERDEVEFGVGDVGEERVGGELDAPRRRDGGGARLDGGDGDVGARAPEHVDCDDRLHRLLSQGGIAGAKGAIKAAGREMRD